MFSDVLSADDPAGSASLTWPSETSRFFRGLRCDCRFANVGCTATVAASLFDQLPPLARQSWVKDSWQVFLWHLFRWRCPSIVLCDKLKPSGLNFRTPSAISTARQSAEGPSGFLLRGPVLIPPVATFHWWQEVRVCHRVCCQWTTPGLRLHVEF